MPEQTRSSSEAPARGEAVAGGPTLALCDAIALAVFVAVGLRSHRIGAAAEIAMRNALPLAVMWVAVALAVGTYRRRDVASLLVTWAVAVPVALLARTWWVGSPQGARIAVFVGVGLAFTLLFLLIGRGAVAALTHTRLVWHRDVDDATAGQ
jgi:Protein of unknown function (DUF3054)